MKSSVRLLALLTLAVAPELHAQACLGLPTVPMQVGLQLTYDNGEDDTGYAARAVGHLPYVGVGLSYRRDEYEVIEESGQTIGGVLAVELPFTPTSLCVVTEPSFSTYDFPPGFGLPAAEVERVRLPALVGVGQVLDVETWYIVPSARAGLVHFRTTADPGTGLATEETATEVMVDAGVTVGTGGTFVNAGINVLSGQETRPRFILGAGLVLP